MPLNIIFVINHQLPARKGSKNETIREARILQCGPVVRNRVPVLGELMSFGNVEVPATESEVSQALAVLFQVSRVVEEFSNQNVSVGLDYVMRTGNEAQGCSVFGPPQVTAVIDKALLAAGFKEVTRVSLG